MPIVAVNWWQIEPGTNYFEQPGDHREQPQAGAERVGAADVVPFVFLRPEHETDARAAAV